jgi:dolichol-phosphate mannosyltransferase
MRNEAISGIAVVIPTYRARAHILRVLECIGPEVTRIYIVDDDCPEKSGRLVEAQSHDSRVQVLYNDKNLGVGGASLVGMKRAAADGAEVIVKIDSDGQMDPALIPSFVGVILAGEADYSKGNRFFEPEGILAMPVVRLIGNAGLSFLAKISTGYWHTFDPTNGFFAIHASLIRLLPLHKISKRYFFESDLLFRLNILAARVIDVPMHSHYGDEVSNLKPHREILGFAMAHLRNFIKRILYSYFIRDFSFASLELLFGLVLTLFGILYGFHKWGTNAPATAGTVMIAALPIVVGSQLLLSFLNYDIQSVPRSALHPRLKRSAQPMRVNKNALKMKFNEQNPSKEETPAGGVRQNRTRAVWQA